ncbi:hypothetical protein FC62_GL001337 [Amylolactobacillus amylotrophicus DSM 20534]|uniref:Uncharacterized protein n=1 Tax=Amylolactobacillus amylotrophicus DSM 20534 TaxID=1423722 RepID=A0A0R1GZH3_9LACO|nr:MULTISPECIES: NusG domain II-containing protein [Amylolactobacillus]KRK37459.1 hypothetical protein FC62_GL001337 [Amylolactobacillus amylotrophicus DSM 20534]GED80527.1 hypothetical protein LAM01_10000 [Amylolactobacillus amylophilus]
MKKWVKGLKENDMFAWGDLVVIGLLVILSFLPLFVFAQQQQAKVDVTSSSSKEVKIMAVVSHDGETIKEFNLTDHEGTTTWTYRDDDGHYNKIEVKGKKIHIVEANCADQVCVRQGYRSKVGQSIVCLPHKLLIEIKSSDGKNVDGGLVN